MKAIDLKHANGSPLRVGDIQAGQTITVNRETGIVQPFRIQRKRSHGWKMPPNTVYVGRPGIFGNPLGAIDSYGLSFEEKHRLHAEAVEAFREWLAASTVGGTVVHLAKWQLMTYRLKELTGKNLSCWCPLTLPCHADVLLETVNNPIFIEINHAEKM